MLKLPALEAGSLLPAILSGGLPRSFFHERGANLKLDLSSPRTPGSKSGSYQSGSKVGSRECGSQVLVLLDVDNTLLDSDRVTADLKSYLTREVDAECTRQYFEVFEQLRTELGYADHLGALQRYRLAHPRDLRLLTVSSFLLNYPFADRLFPGSLAALEHLGTFGPTVILSDGDVVFQPLKIERSGLAEAVGGRVLVYIHKELELADVAQRFPAGHYVMVDDKVRILAAVKEFWGKSVTTVFPRQGHYAHNPDVANYRRPDITIQSIGELLDYSQTSLIQAARAKHAL